MAFQDNETSEREVEKNTRSEVNTSNARNTVRNAHNVSHLIT